MASSSKRSGMDRHQRAARAVANTARHVEQYLDNVSALVHDSAEAAEEALEAGAYPFERWAADMVALSVNAWSTACCCFHEEEGPDSDDETDVPGEVTFTTFDVTIEERTSPADFNLFFDIRSEMAGPIEQATSSPLALESFTSLEGEAGVITKEQVVVRVLPDRIIVSLRDLKQIAPGTYRGKITLRDGANRVERSVRAECKNRLWWT